MYPIIHVSEKSKKSKALGFPPPYLGDRPLRLPILSETEDWIALDKPADIGTRAYHWDETPDLDTALNTQLQGGKPELLRTGASLFGSIYYLDPVISGAVVFAKNRAALATLKNRFGSGECRFRFLFIAQPAETETSEWLADAPLLPHRVKPKMIPSTAKGKKCSTVFRCLSRSQLGWALWEATTHFFRPHQIRAHAAVHGIPVLGDTLYGGPEPPTVRQLQPRKQRSDLDLPVYSGLALHLHELDLEANDDSTVVSPLPKHLSLLLKRMELADSAASAN